MAADRAYSVPTDVAGFLVINPRSGRGGGPSAAELAEAARERGIEPHVLRRGDDPGSLARGAAAEAIGSAGGDGSLAPLAEVALERGLPFVCIPFGTRNHFARDLGLDPGDPIRALAAFGGEERRLDLGRAGGRAFLNNVSFGAYASLVHRRERHRRRRDALARLRALARTLRHPERLRLAVDGEPLAVRALLIANNAYELRAFDLGARRSLSEGRLHLYAAKGLLPTAWEERSAESFTLTAAGSLAAAVDGEPTVLQTPLKLSIEPRGLRVLVPPGS